MFYAPSRADEVVRMLDRSLCRFFGDNDSVSIETERVARDDADAATCLVHLSVDGECCATARFIVEHVGGNVYDVRGGLDDEPSKCFTCSLPDAGPTSERVPIAPSLGRDVGDFLLGTLERMIGARTLRQPTLVAG